MAYVLGYPFVDAAIVTQTFAEHVERARANGWCWQPGPCKSGIYYYGGVDFGVSVGTDVLAGMDGSVIRAEHDASGYGLHVRVQSGRYTLIYAHMSKAMVKAGQNITRGQRIGLSGNTGNSTGPHLHLEVRENGKPVDPWPMMRYQPAHSPHPSPLPVGEGEEGEGFLGRIPAVGVLPKGRTTYVMNLRRGPSTDWPVVGQVPAGVDLAFLGFEVEDGENLWGCIGGYPSEWVAVAFAGRWLVELEISPSN